MIDDNTGRLLHRASEAYRPTAEQVAHVRAAYVRSAGPGSLVSAERCDIDHVIPHPEGATVIGNLAPFDRSWHGDKTRKSLTVSIDDMGTITVTTPLGQTRQVDPYDYRACKQPAPSSPDVENPDATSDPDHDDQAPPF